MTTKCCSKCGEVKELGEFYKHKGYKDGVTGSCKVCKSEYAKTYRKKNTEQIKEYKKTYRKKNPAQIKKHDKKYYKENSDKRREYKKTYRKNRRRTDPLYKLAHNTRNLIGLALLKRGYSKTSRSREILGCSYEHLYTWLNTGANNGLTPYDNTHIDHVVPISWGQSEEEVLALSHYSNLQLLTPEENLTKRDGAPRPENYERVLATHPNPQLIKMIYGRKNSHAQNREARERERI